MTDSGSIQKEAYMLKKPCVTLRDETEWVETVVEGWNILTGTDKEKIVSAVNSFKMPYLRYAEFAANKIFKGLTGPYKFKIY